jgi:uncharacterized surface protein with fasciclin (FAS1) repeats
MSKLFASSLISIALTAAVIPLSGAMAGSAGHAKHHSTVVSAAAQSADHTTLVAAVKAAGLAETLAGKGPFTVFAPSNAAFAKLPAGTVETLLQPANLGTLRAVLTYHVVPGSYDAATIVGAIKAGDGKATLKTVQGEVLTATLEGGKVIVTDKRGGTASVTAADLRQSNGIIHVTDAVSLPG